MSVDNEIRHELEKARKELLDLSLRNRLLNTPLRSKRSRAISIVGESSDGVFRILVRENKPMSFLPKPDPAENGSEQGKEHFAGLKQPEDEEVDEKGIPIKYTDTRLQTNLPSEQLQKSLLSLYYDARMFQEEQGVNILFLAIGFVKWFEDDSSERERFAPLLLIPVSLERSKATSRFKLSYFGDEISTNLSFQAYLAASFGINLPDLPDIEEITPSMYFEKVRSVIQEKKRWEVMSHEMVSGFFSFSKFLMYRDLDPQNWPEQKRISTHPLISALLKEGFKHDPPLCAEDEKIDSLFLPLNMVYVLDADSSQTVVIEEVKKGRNLVIQGPPGTGKSQTIANIAACAVRAGKSVLFVAEKMAALEVVKRRLDNVGLEDVCLELHSHKANKRIVLEELGRTLKIARPVVQDVERLAEELRKRRDRLNYHAEVMHQRDTASSLTSYRTIGELVRLRGKGVAPADFHLDGAEDESVPLLVEI